MWLASHTSPIDASSTERGSDDPGFGGYLTPLSALIVMNKSGVEVDVAVERDMTMVRGK